MDSPAQAIIAREAAGIFWIAAELIILFALLAALRHLNTEPLPPAFTLTKRERLQALTGSVGLALFTLALLGRHLFHVHSPDLRFHYLLWAVFITLWVILEALIVYYGFCGYRRLGRLLAPLKPNRLATYARLFLPMLLFAHATAEAAAPDALRLYVRIAGFIWTAVEWAAAYILWRTYRLLANHARSRSSEP